MIYIWSVICLFKQTKVTERDNNYSITTQQLAQSIMKSAGAASTYGVELERLIGYSTSIGEITRESGNVIGNSLKSIFSRITSIPGAIDGMSEIGISIHDMNGGLRDVDDILDDLGGKWNSLSREQQQNLGLQIAGKHTCQPSQKWLANKVLNSGELWRQTIVSQTH